GVAVVARGAVGLVDRAGAGGRVAGAALIDPAADDGVRTHARADLAGIGLRAGVARDAGGAGGLVDRAGAGGRVAGAALIDPAADDGVRSHARADLAGIGLRAGVAVVARGAVGLVDRAGAEGRVAGAALIDPAADDGVRTHARADLAGIGLRAG